MKRRYARVCRIAVISSANCWVKSLTSALKLVTASRKACTGVVFLFVCIFNTMRGSVGCGFLYPANTTSGFLCSSLGVARARGQSSSQRAFTSLFAIASFVRRPSPPRRPRVRFPHSCAFHLAFASHPSTHIRSKFPIV